MNLTFIRHGLCRQTREARFGADGPLDSSCVPLARIEDTPAVCSPTAISRESAAALGLKAVPDPKLSPANYGYWNGLPLQAVQPDELRQWRSDPDYRGHGGESIVDLLQRTSQWLGQLDRTQDLIIVTHAENIRAAVAVTSDNIDAYWSDPLCHLRAFDSYALSL
ncbi:histidine phosphatase family protein [Arthrobacter globiformis]|uniref:histidine phosphatase family protein n=1 Tax=Arthrobacter globiformis TaxID=1665 RepID=UPI00278E006F|nr:histidine phosphatase family protein [Arthrobacter globiformis]MDQ0618242.1 broad specificity phosphatase PhoE [Arthrobacter globiformis]